MGDAYRIFSVHWRMLGDSLIFKSNDKLDSFILLFSVYARRSLIWHQQMGTQEQVSLPCSLSPTTDSKMVFSGLINFCHTAL